MIKRWSLFRNASASLQRTLAAEAHVAEGKFLLEEQKLCKGKSTDHQQFPKQNDRICNQVKLDDNNNNYINQNRSIKTLYSLRFK